MIIGPILIAIGSLGTALTPYFSLLLVAQLVTGAGAGLWQMGRELTAVDLVRAEERGRVMASFFGISHAGITFGPVIGGVITDFVSFKAVFLAYMAMSIAVLAVSMTMKETGKRVRGGEERGMQWGFGALRSIEPYYRVTFVVLIIATNAAILRSTAVNSILPLYVGTELGYTATAVGSLFGISGLFTLLFIMPAGFVSDKIGRKAASGPAAALAAVVFLGFSLTHNIFAFSVLAAILGIANAFSMGAMTTYTYDISPEGARGQLQGLRRTSGEVGGIGGPVLGGLIAHLFGPARVFLLFAPLHAVSALLIFFVARESLVSKRPMPQQGGVSEGPRSEVDHDSSHDDEDSSPDHVPGHTLHPAEEERGHGHGEEGLGVLKGHDDAEVAVPDGQGDEELAPGSAGPGDDQGQEGPPPGHCKALARDRGRSVQPSE